MGIAPMSKIDNSKSSTSLVCFFPDKIGVQQHAVRNKQNLHMSFSEFFHFVRLKNRAEQFSCLTPRSAYEKSAVRWLKPKLKQEQNLQMLAQMKPAPLI